MKMGFFKVKWFSWVFISIVIGLAGGSKTSTCFDACVARTIPCVVAVVLFDAPVKGFERSANTPAYDLPSSGLLSQHCILRAEVGRTTYLDSSELPCSRLLRGKQLTMATRCKVPKSRSAPLEILEEDCAWECKSSLDKFLGRLVRGLLAVILAFLLFGFVAVSVLM